MSVIRVRTGYTCNSEMVFLIGPFSLPPLHPSPIPLCLSVLDPPLPHLKNKQKHWKQSEDFGEVLDPGLTQNISIMLFTPLVLLKFRAQECKERPPHAQIYRTSSKRPGMGVGLGSEVIDSFLSPSSTEMAV